MAGGFRLGGLLRLRRLQEDQAAADLARAAAERRAAERRRRETAAELGSTALPAAGDDLSFQVAVANRASLMGLLAESMVCAEVARVRADGAQAVWTACRTAVRTLDKLEEHHEASVRAEELHVEQLLLDEAATRRATQVTGDER